MMTERKKNDDAVTRREFVRQGAAIGIGLGALTSASANVIPVPPSAILDLRKQIGSAKVLIPGDSAYAKTGLPANGRYRDIRPEVIATCADESDVAKCVKWCRSANISPVVRGGGHSYAGYSTTTGLLIDIGRLNSVQTRDDGTVNVGGAALNSDVYRETKDSPYLLPGGTCLGVGVGGLVLGGGIGYNSRWAGLTADSLLSTRFVTASGELVDANANTNPDLFWACCGGAGGNFGINTSFKFRLTKAPATVTFFLYEWRNAPQELAVQLFSEFNKLMATDESRLNAVANSRAEDGGRGGLYARTRGQFIGNPAELRFLLRSFPARRETPFVVKEMPYWEAAKIFTDPPPPSHSFGDISRYAAKPISHDAITRQVDLLTKCPSHSTDASGSMWSLGWVGGRVMNSVARTETAYVHRGMSTLLRPTCSWPDDAPRSVGDQLLNWTEEMTAIVAPETPNESYQNFPNRLIKDWQQQYYAENLPRLIDVKTKYDGQNLFNNAQSIPPKSI